MTKDQQKAYIIKLCDNVKSAILAKFDDIPDYWGEFELRQYLCNVAERFNPQRMVLSGMRRYSKDVREHGL